MATVELDAGTFYYADYGDRAGMPLVLLHGMPRDHSSWAGVAPDLAAAGCRVITPDLRGHGASARTSTYSLEEMREDVHQFTGELGLDRFVLGGHSMGGTVATLFAERYPALPAPHPRRHRGRVRVTVARPALLALAVS